MSPCTWVITRHNLCLNVALNWPKYKDSDLILPPPVLGRCTEWRFEISSDELTATFKASWDKRRIKRDVSIEELDDTITRYLA
jgi:hypothetical protein